MLDIDIQRACKHSDHLPDDATLRQWLTEVFKTTGKKEATSLLTEAELSIRFVEPQESQGLNFEYRAKDSPTNVLSFPCELPADVDIPLLGDIVVCTHVLKDEATAQSKTLTAHCAHIVIHGALHLLGYDHIEDADAQQMEALEINILNQLGFKNPYSGS